MSTLLSNSHVTSGGLCAMLSSCWPKVLRVAVGSLGDEAVGRVFKEDSRVSNLTSTSDPWVGVANLPSEGLPRRFPPPAHECWRA